MPRRLRTTMARHVGRRGLLLMAALATVVVGAIVIWVAVNGQESVPQVSPSSYGKVSATPVLRTPTRSQGTTSPSPSSGSPTAVPLTLARSVPTSIAIPAIGVRSDVISVGKNADGSLAVPQPGPDLNKVAWYDGSVTPGQAGPAVLEGHVDTVEGASIFLHLADTRPGDTIIVTRADGSTATFTVNAVRSYATHADFPIAQIFGSDLADPTLRLITCSNFDHSTGHYVGNTVVFAHLTAIKHA